MERNAICAEELIGRDVGQYRVEGLVRQTRKSWVFEAVDSALERRVALKVLKPTEGRDRQEQFVREGRRLAKLGIKHNGIAAVYSAGEDCGLYYLAMEFIEGKDVQECIDSGERFSLRRITDMMASLAEAINYCHEIGIEHNDIKLKNLKERGESKGLCVLDFGSRLTRDKSLDDVRSIGFVAKQLLDARQRPDKSIPKGLERVVESARTGRYKDATELKTAIEGYRKAISRRKFINLVAGTAALLGAGYHGIRIYNYFNSLNYLVDEIRKVEPDNFNEIGALFKELDKGIFNQKIKRTAAMIKSDESPFGTSKNKGWQKTKTSTTPKYSDGFWRGILWRGFEVTGDPQFKKWAEEGTEAIQLAPEDKIATTAVRFFYSHGKGFNVLVSKNRDEPKRHKSRALSALELFVKRFDSYGRIIPLIEGNYRSEATTMGDVVPFLLWGHEVTGKKIYLDVALAHTNSILTYNLRGDNSFTKTAIFNPYTQEKIGEENSNGYNNTGAVSRVQAQVHHGLVEVYRATSDRKFLSVLGRGVDYFISNLPEDGIPKCDFRAPANAKVPRDSSAAAIEQHALNRLFEITKEEKWKRIANSLRKSLVLKCLSTDVKIESGVLKHACSNMNSGMYNDESLIYGDYYFLDA